MGLIVNLFWIYNLRRGSNENLNVQGAFLEVVSDTLSSVGVILASLIMCFTGWYLEDFESDARFDGFSAAVDSVWR